jgi:Mrp family chromosome partitioning ATPase
MSNNTKQLPTNFGPLKGANANARILGPCGDTMEFWLWVEGEKILKATFTTDGCHASIASGSMAANFADGKTVDQADNIGADQILRELGGLPADHVHCPILAVKTLKAAIANYRTEKRRASGPKPGTNCAHRPSDPELKPSPIKPQGGHGILPKDEQSVRKRVSRIAFKIVVLSGKGGVGKSTVAANLACALASAGKRVGLLDVDLHGPSIPKLLGLEGAQLESTNGVAQPVVFSNQLKVVSVGFLLGNAKDAIIWRGPMKYSAIQQFLSEVEWGDLDVLVVDCPPGTGDEPLAVVQLIERPAAAVVVTTPQQVAVSDVRRSLTFCQQTGLPVLGVIENMSGYACVKCGNIAEVFKSGGGAQLAQEMGVPFLGTLPLDPQVMNSGDSGTSFVERFPDSVVARAFAGILQTVLQHIEKTPESLSK